MHSFLFRYKETCEREKGRGGEDGFPGGSDSKESACNARDLGSVPGLRRSPGEGNGYSLQCSGLENSTDSVVHGIAELDTTERLSFSRSFT